MPDDGGRAEADDIAGILKTPADVDIIAGRAIDRIEAAQPHQHLAAERHVAARDVLGDFVADQYMRRTTRRDGHRGVYEALLERRHIWGAATNQAAPPQLRDNRCDPIPVGEALAVGKGA